MMAEYLTLVRPVEVFLSKKFNCKGATDLDEFLWADYRKGRWDGDFISDLLKVTTSGGKMQTLGFRDYRQVALAFMEQHLKYKMKDLKGLNAYFDLQAGHTSRTAAADYAVSTDDHVNVSREAMHQYYLISKAWHELLLTYGIKNKVIKDLNISGSAEIQRHIEMEPEVIDNNRPIPSDSSPSRSENLRSRTLDTAIYGQGGISIEL